MPLQLRPTAAYLHHSRERSGSALGVTASQMQRTLPGQGGLPAPLNMRLQIVTVNHVVTDNTAHRCNPSENQFIEEPATEPPWVT